MLVHRSKNRVVNVEAGQDAGVVQYYTAVSTFGVFAVILTLVELMPVVIPEVSSKALSGQGFNSIVQRGCESVVMLRNLSSDRYAKFSEKIQIK